MKLFHEHTQVAEVKPTSLCSVFLYLFFLLLMFSFVKSLTLHCCHLLSFFFEVQLEQDGVEVPQGV